MNQAKKRILISDCDEEVLISLEHTLEDAGFDTTTACTTGEAIRLLGQREFDLILAADHPPELSCELLLRNLQTGGIPLVALENQPRHPFAEQYLLSLGARRIVHKWRPDEVQSVVQELLITQSGEVTKSAVAGTAKLG